MYILFGSYGKQFVKIDKIPNSNTFLSLSLSFSLSLKFQYEKMVLDNKYWHADCFRVRLTIAPLNKTSAVIRVRTTSRAFSNMADVKAINNLALWYFYLNLYLVDGKEDTSDSPSG